MLFMVLLDCRLTRCFIWRRVSGRSGSMRIGFRDSQLTRIFKRLGVLRQRVSRLCTVPVRQGAGVRV